MPHQTSGQNAPPIMEGLQGKTTDNLFDQYKGLVALTFCLGCFSCGNWASAEEAWTSTGSDAYSTSTDYANWSEMADVDGKSAGQSCACCRPGWFIQLDYLNWKPRRTGLGVAILDPAGTGVPSAGNPVQSLDMGRDSDGGSKWAVAPSRDGTWGSATRISRQTIS